MCDPILLDLLGGSIGIFLYPTKELSKCYQILGSNGLWAPFMDHSFFMCLTPLHRTPKHTKRKTKILSFFFSNLRFDHYLMHNVGIGLPCLQSIKRPP